MPLGGFVSLRSDLGFAFCFFWPMARLPLARHLWVGLDAPGPRTLYYRLGSVKNTRSE
jgi:hypothetical protein